MGLTELNVHTDSQFLINCKYYKDLVLYHIFKALLAFKMKSSTYLFYHQKFIGLNTIYFTSIKQKSLRRYGSVLEGTDVGALWCYLVENTRVTGGNHRPQTGDHYQEFIIVYPLTK